MKTTLAFRPDFAEFDIHRALSWIVGEADWVGLRHVREDTHRRAVRNLRPEHNGIALSRGAMVEALVDGQIAYAGTADLSPAGLRLAARRAAELAKATARLKPCALSPRPPSRGRFAGSPGRRWPGWIRFRWKRSPANCWKPAAA
jgi:predicted Zn-dependent protease